MPTGKGPAENDPFQGLGLSSLTARVLRNRGIRDTDAARRFLFPALADLPDPFTMKDMEKAVARIIQAVRHGEKIILFGDYDVDGITATALLLLFLKELGAAVDFYLPHRLREGYSLNLEAVKRIRGEGAGLLITADCGISSLEEIRWGNENGLATIVTDHHEVPERVPPAFALLNPKQKGCGYSFAELAGVGVAFNLLIALRSRLRQEGFFRDSGPNLKEYLDLVALGTISDVVPLRGVNRILAKHGLQQMNQSRRPGIWALREAAAAGEGPVDTALVHFRLAPRINAAGRLQDAREAVALLATRDREEARRIAAHLEELNTDRQRIEEEIFHEARGMIDAGAGMGKSFVLASPQWHPGVIGIVASRLAEEFNRPTILIALQQDLGKGSGRTIKPFSLYEGIKDCRKWVERFGGHDQAVGLLIRREHVPAFARAFEEVVCARLAEEDFIPRQPIDTLAALSEMNGSLLSELESLGPFGMGNPEPVVGVEGLTVLESRRVGRDHLRLRMKEGRLIREAIGFRMASFHPLPDGLVKVALSPQLGFFQGQRTLQLKIVDLQPME